ncbi:ATP-binding protein [Gilvimarinus sp. DA14]|uniref:ATP-binding protein n=1 Tax=Gilvimarinus sp. DA14 TaxID=2956798 RepID=UPI0020B7F9CD|nr:ATP-binding protein [Gilvimarinus sp. DA14]UTF60295.1 ATP-binding protein [Gilvimarinus sp. DA14]
MQYRLYRPRELDDLSARLAALVEAGELPEALVSDIMVIVDELLSNLLKYGGGSFLNIELQRENETIELLCRDDGSPFNPLKNERPNLDLPIEQREIGGLGIELILTLTARQHYWREREYNRLLLTLPIPQ